MGICESNGNINKEQPNRNIESTNHYTGQTITNNRQPIENEKPSFRCTYDIKDNNTPIQIINCREGNLINKEIEEKIKILNNCKKEKLCLKKKLIKKEITALILL